MRGLSENPLDVALDAGDQAIESEKVRNAAVDDCMLVAALESGGETPLIDANKENLVPQLGDEVQQFMRKGVALVLC